jgi:hypothetical protein
MSDLFAGEVGNAKDEREYLTVMISGTKHYFALSSSVDPAFAARMGNPGSYNRRRYLERGARRTLKMPGDPQRWAWVSPDYACSLEHRGDNEDDYNEDDYISDEEEDEVAFDWVQ